MEEKKISAIALLKVLEEYSDEEHILSQPELLKHIKSIYHISLDRRTLYKNVEMLLDFGYDISTYAENGKGYYLRERQFEKSQIFLLCNAIHSSNLIPTNSSKELINKLLSTQSKYYKNDFRTTVFADNRNKKENNEFFLNIELISEAIKKRKTISFNYTQYDINKKLVLRRPEPYKCSPYYLIYVNERTYLVSKSENHDDLTHFRIDRMKNVKITKDNYIRPSKNEDPYEYAKNKLFMFHGDEENITIKCDMCILDDIIDIFGKNVPLEICDSNHFKAHINSTFDGILHLATQYLDHMEVISPKKIRDEMKQILKEANSRYK